MKFSEIKTGVAYYHDLANDWLDRQSFRTFKVIFSDLTRYRKIDRFRGPEYVEDPRGQYLKGVRPADPASPFIGRSQAAEVYVRPNAIRGTWDVAQALYGDVQTRRQAARQASYDRRDRAAERGGQLTERARRHGLGLETSIAGDGRLVIVVDADDLQALLDRLDTPTEE